MVMIVTSVVVMTVIVTLVKVFVIAVTAGNFVGSNFRNLVHDDLGGRFGGCLHLLLLRLLLRLLDGGDSEQVLREDAEPGQKSVVFGHEGGSAAAAGDGRLGGGRVALPVDVGAGNEADQQDDQQRHLDENATDLHPGASLLPFFSFVSRLPGPGQSG